MMPARVAAWRKPVAEQRLVGAVRDQSGTTPNPSAGELRHEHRPYQRAREAVPDVDEGGAVYFYDAERRAGASYRRRACSRVVTADAPASESGDR